MRRSFFETVRDLNNGKALLDCDEALHALVQAIQTTNKGGSLTLKVDIAPIKGSTMAVSVKASVNSKEPEFEDVGTIMFPTPEGNLSRNNYRQQDLPLPSPVSLATGAAGVQLDDQERSAG